MPLPIDIYDRGMRCTAHISSPQGKIQYHGDEAERFLDMGEQYYFQLEKVEIRIGYVQTMRFALVFLQMEVQETTNFAVSFLPSDKSVFAGCQQGYVRISENTAWTELESGFFFYRSSPTSPIWEVHVNKGLCSLLLICSERKAYLRSVYSRSHFSPKIWIVVHKLPNYISEETRKPQLDGWIAILENEAHNISLSLNIGRHVTPAIPGYFIENAYQVGNKIINGFDRFETLSQISGGYRLSGRYFKRAFKELYGCQPKQLQKRVRMQKAVFLLKQGMPVQTVAKSLGFMHFREFKKAFMAYFGEEPTTIRLP